MLATALGAGKSGGQPMGYAQGGCRRHAVSFWGWYFRNCLRVFSGCNDS